VKYIFAGHTNRRLRAVSIEHNYGMYTAVCDICDTEIEPPLKDFYATVNLKKRSGWKSRKTGKYDENGEPVWEDLCPDCQNN